MDPPSQKTDAKILHASARASFKSMLVRRRPKTLRPGIWQSKLRIRPSGHSLSSAYSLLSLLWTWTWHRLSTTSAFAGPRVEPEQEIRHFSSSSSMLFWGGGWRKLHESPLPLRSPSLQSPGFTPWHEKPLELFTLRFRFLLSFVRQ